LSSANFQSLCDIFKLFDAIISQLVWNGLSWNSFSYWSFTSTRRTIGILARSHSSLCSNIYLEDSQSEENLLLPGGLEVAQSNQFNNSSHVNQVFNFDFIKLLLLIVHNQKGDADHIITIENGQQLYPQLSVLWDSDNPCYFHVKVIRIDNPFSGAILLTDPQSLCLFHLLAGSEME
jgi:hypothetical protein